MYFHFREVTPGGGRETTRRQLQWIWGFHCSFYDLGSFFRQELFVSDCFGALKRYELMQEQNIMVN